MNLDSAALLAQIKFAPSNRDADCDGEGTTNAGVLQLAPRGLEGKMGLDRKSIRGVRAEAGRGWEKSAAAAGLELARVQEANLLRTTGGGVSRSAIWYSVSPAQRR
jgi:hypothetical protein